MFSPGLVNNLDNLAREGIIDFDATAFITGTNPRYIGNPSYAHLPLPDMSMIDTTNLKQPGKDEMVYANPEKNGVISRNPLWKKVLFGLIAGGLIIGGGYKLYKTKPFKNFLTQTVPNFFKNIGDSVKNISSDIWNKITGKATKTAKTAAGRTP